MISRGGCPALSDPLGKTCSRCGEWFPLAGFVRQAATRDGLACACRACTRDSVRRSKAGIPRACLRCGTDVRGHGRATLCRPCRVRQLEERRRPNRAPKPKVVRTPYLMRLRQRPVTRSFIAGSCPVCGSSFVALAGTNPRYCSALCTKRAGRQLHVQRFRAAEKFERIYRRKVFERDAWTCRLCMKPIDRDARVPDPLSATIDHILPLALGGAHVYENVQAAHFICNSAKAHNVTQLSFAA